MPRRSTRGQTAKAKADAKAVEEVDVEAQVETVEQVEATQEVESVVEDTQQIEISVTQVTTTTTVKTVIHESHEGESSSTGLQRKSSGTLEAVEVPARKKIKVDKKGAVKRAQQKVVEEAVVDETAVQQHSNEVEVEKKVDEKVEKKTGRKRTRGAHEESVVEEAVIVQEEKPTGQPSSEVDEKVEKKGGRKRARGAQEESVVEEPVVQETSNEVDEKAVAKGKKAVPKKKAVGKQSKGRAFQEQKSVEGPVATETLSEDAVPVVAKEKAISKGKAVLKERSAAPEPSSEPSPQDKLKEQMARLAQLKRMRDASQKLNREDVKEEYRKLKEPKKDPKAERHREKAEKLLAQQNAEAAGEDYERVRAMNYTAEDVERWDAKMREKERGKNTGFTDFTQIQAKKYNKLIKDLKPNLAEYAEQRAHLAEGGDESAFYRDADSLAYANPSIKPSTDAVDRLVADLEKQEKRRANFSRRRAFDEDDDVTYINERNMHFNKKIARSYDKYTAEIKGNFERGTAL
ncbi:SYF2 splicing factor-domain-containing protein [Phlyctochytrium arcticum]|nr:SYF2 splicing factor-domain-containing protein [Phlyctochytrium arcticum]